AASGRISHARTLRPTRGNANWSGGVDVGPARQDACRHSCHLRSDVGAAGGCRYTREPVRAIAASDPRRAAVALSATDAAFAAKSRTRALTRQTGGIIWRIATAGHLVACKDDRRVGGQRTRIVDRTAERIAAIACRAA